MGTSMKNPISNEVRPISFSDFPEDVQLCILSFLTPSELSTFACTSKRYASICREDPRLWFSMCDSRWGSYTLPQKWGNGKISYKFLYKTLLEYENLIGFWRRSGSAVVTSGIRNSDDSASPLVFFEWGPFYIAGSRVSPSKTGGYEVIKTPFLWMGITSKGELLNYLDTEGRVGLRESLVDLDELGFTESELIPVNVNFMGKSHIVVEENMSSFWCNSNSMLNGGFKKLSSCGNVREEEYEDLCGYPGSLPDRLMPEIYQYFANRTSHGGNGSSRRLQRREKEKQGRRKWEPEHFVKVVNCSPTPARPLKGLWKGISGDMALEFFLVFYDDVGGIACRRIAESWKPFSGYAPVFWTSNTTFIESPFSLKEQDIYDSRIHLQPLLLRSGEREVVRMLCMNSSYDLVIPDLAGSSVNPQQVEGRIWLYADGTFGFGFLRDNYIIDLRHIAQNGQILDIDFTNE